MAEKYVCEDAGRALGELEQKLRADRRELKANRKSSYDEGVLEGYSRSLKRLEETKDNWKATWLD